MALNPRFAGHRIGNPGGHTVELYLDFVCPWCGIMIAKLSTVNVSTGLQLIVAYFPESGKRLSKYMFYLPSPGTILAPFFDDDT